MRARRTSRASSRTLSPTTPWCSHCGWPRKEQEPRERLQQESPREAAQRRADGRRRPCACARDAQRRRLHGRRPGQAADRCRHDVDRDEAVGAHAAGSMSDTEVHALENVACPGAGACGGHYTANTMATALDFLGVSAPGLNEVPATHPGKPHAAVTAGELAMKLVESDTRPSSVLTRDAFENAITAIAGTGGSTNGALHPLAIADGAGSGAKIDGFDTSSAPTPTVADVKPGGRYGETG